MPGASVIVSVPPLQNTYRLTKTKVKLLPLKEVVDLTVKHTGVNEIDLVDLDAEGSEVSLRQNLLL